MPVYRATGQLTHAIPSERVAEAQAYLTAPDYMTGIMNDHAELNGALEFIEWQLQSNGHDYRITAVTNRELTDDELARLSENCSGQNSDGHGEGFEQQDFAWLEDEDEEETCGACMGSGYFNEDDEDCSECDGEGVFVSDGQGVMCSFDWQTNKLPFTRVDVTSI